MARRNNDPPSVGDNAKVRVVFAEVEGSNESVQEALKTMVAAMSRPVRIIQTKSIDDVPALVQQENDTPTINEILDSEAPSAPGKEADVARKPRGSGPKTDRNAGIALVPDLNFRPENSPTLREFFAEKAPGNDMEEILVVTYYMQHTMGLSNIGLGHIRTALKDVGKGIPLDMSQTARNMRNKKAWVKYTQLDNITTATAGENHVLHDMGKKAQ